MKLEEYIKSLHKDILKFEQDMKEYQKKGELPEDIDEGEWVEQFLATFYRE